MKNRSFRGIAIAVAVAASITALTACQSGQPGDQAPSASHAPFTHAQTHAMDRKIGKLLDEHNLPGAIVLVKIPGKGEYFSAQGTANLKTDEPPARDDTFRIGSVTKTFTATVVLQLADKGTLAVTDPLSRWYPDFPNASQITIEDLLQMRSGIPEYWEAAELQSYFDDPLEAVTPDQIIAATAARAAEFTKPGEKTAYNNVNYTLLERIIEMETGRPLAETITSDIVQPAGLSHTHYPTSSNLPGPLHGYGWNEKISMFEDKTELNPAPAGGSGAMIGTVDDLAAWSKMLYTGKGLLNAEAQKARMTLPPPLEPRGGYGEGIIEQGGFWGHNGTIAGFSTEMWYSPKLDAEVVVAVNRSDAHLKSEAGIVFQAVISGLLHAKL